MEPGLELAISWWDEDILEIQIFAANGRYSGVAECYDGRDAFALAAAALQGFPTGAGDHRQIEFGAFDEDSPRGGVRLDFRCLNAAGHAAAGIVMRHRPEYLSGPVETASFQIDVEASAIDNFCRTLRSMNSARRGRAFLPALPRGH